MILAISVAILHVCGVHLAISYGVRRILAYFDKRESSYEQRLFEELQPTKNRIERLQRALEKTDGDLVRACQRIGHLERERENSSTLLELARKSGIIGQSENPFPVNDPVDEE